DVFASREARAPSLFVAQPGAVAVTWSHFPAPSDHKRRAQVGLGGQKHVRFDGWSPLEGRTFTAEKRLFAEPGRLWARVGAPVAMERKDGFVRVMGEAGEMGFDAWVRAGDVEEDAMAGLGLSGFGTSGCGGAMSAEHGIVKRDAALFVGSAPIALAGAVVEKD